MSAIARHCPTKVRVRDLQPESIPRFRQDILLLHQAMTQRPKGGLAEVADLGMLQVDFTRHQGNLHVGDGVSGKHAVVSPLRQMAEHQPLPIAIQSVLAHASFQHKALPRSPRFQQKMNFGIVPQGFKVAYSHHRGGDGLFINDTATAESHIQPKAVFSSAGSAPAALHPLDAPVPGPFLHSTPVEEGGSPVPTGATLPVDQIHPLPLRQAHRKPALVPSPDVPPPAPRPSRRRFKCIPSR